MERKHKIEIVFAIMVIVALIIFVWFLLRPTQDTAEISLDENQSQDIQESQELIEIANHQKSASTIARVFVERFGSFSNQGDYENITSVIDISTESLQIRLNDLIESASSHDAGTYYGVSTYVISINQIKVSDEREVLEVVTQSETSVSSPSNASVEYRTIRVELVKSGNTWLVDDFEWID